MAKYSAAGHKIVFLYLTRGEAYDSSKTHEMAAAERTKEAEIACAGLNVSPRFVGQVDGNTQLNPQQNESFLKIIESVNPDLVFTQSPMDTHPDHQVTGLLVLNAWTKMNRSFELYFYEVNTGSETMSFVPTDYVDISGYHDQKKAAMWAAKPKILRKPIMAFLNKWRNFVGWTECPLPKPLSIIKAGWIRQKSREFKQTKKVANFRTRQNATKTYASVPKAD